jgi:hypothetical protein
METQRYVSLFCIFYHHFDIHSITCVFAFVFTETIAHIENHV